MEKIWAEPRAMARVARGVHPPLAVTAWVFLYVQLPKMEGRNLEDIGSLPSDHEILSQVPAQLVGPIMMTWLVFKY